MSKRSRQAPAGAFTLVEVLAVVAIIGILVALVSSALGSARTRANATREISAARQLMIAYQDYTSDNNGELLPGYGPFPATDETGTALNSPENQRYPWRLAPYLSYNMRILWGNTDDAQLRNLANGPRDSYIYGLSLQPSLGYNIDFVGGDYSSLAPTNPALTAAFGAFCLTHMGQGSRPAQIIAFASAGSGSNMQTGTRLSGYFKIEPPFLTARRWPSTWTTSTSPDQTGFVNFRYDKKAVVAMLDGHVESLTFAQMTDMRRWSSQAADADNPNWTLGTATP